MGFQFSIEHANWIASALGEGKNLAQAPSDSSPQQALHEFLASFSDGLETRDKARRKRAEGINAALSSGEPVGKLMARVRALFRDVKWTGLLIPEPDLNISYARSDFFEDLARPSAFRRPSRDNLIYTDRAFLRELVDSAPTSDGLLLQLSEPPSSYINLEHAFPAIQVALNHATRWPGLLLWKGESGVFLSTRSMRLDDVRTALRDVMRGLSDHKGSPDLSAISTAFDAKWRDKLQTAPSVILHLSDLHLGSNLALRRLPRIQAIISRTTEKLEAGALRSVITGDLMDTPSEVNAYHVRAFSEFLRGSTGSIPILVPGNHDVRKDGWLGPIWQHVIPFSRQLIEVDDIRKVVFCCFNSNAGGKLARGNIGEDALAEMGDQIDTLPAHARHYPRIAVLHHHPVPVEKPDWYKPAWYETLLGSLYEHSDDLVDAARFLNWCAQRHIAACLHGHKHIPRFVRANDMSVIGCGSSVGKVDTVKKGTTLISLNLIAIDHQERALHCRLRGETVVGGGVTSLARYEASLITPLITP